MDWRTKLLDPTARARRDYQSLATPVYRGSTVVFDSARQVSDHWDQSEHGFSYGLYGTPTALELAARIAEIENAHRSFIVPGGQAAIALIYLAFCKSGDHALVPYSAYGPNQEMAEGMLRGLGIDVEPYDPMLGASIADLIRESTTLIWCESPGSVTMEVQDVPSIVQAAHASGVAVAIDNTYSAGVMFDAFAHGVDVSMQALTKYVGGHSDILLGSVSIRDENAYERIGPIYRQLGLAVSPDDCSLALRGLQSMVVRLAHMERSALELARWLTEHPAVEAVFHPALPSCPGHQFWKRDFTGSASVFSILFRDDVSRESVENCLDALTIFRLGLSWGGVNALAVVYPDLVRPGKDYAGRLVRLNVGLEETRDLIDDLDNAMRKAGITT